MGKASHSVPGGEAVNNRLLQSGERNLEQLRQAEQRIATRRLDPEYQHPANRERLDALAAKVEEQQAVLAEEIDIRQELAEAIKSEDKVAQQIARDKLKALRAAHSSDYGKSASVSVCVKCIDKKLAAAKKVRKPESPAAMSDLITGMFEGKEPDYCAVADSPSDAGGLSYGKHQAAEKKGGLHKMLSAYVQQTDPAPDAAVKVKIAAQLEKFSEGHDAYLGSAADRVAFKSAMKTACGDPAMRRAQDDFFEAGYMKPAMESAEELCVKSSLGRAMLYDLAIQSGPGRIDTLAPKAMKRLGKDKDAACRPCDPEGPSEPEFLQALNDERRAFVSGLGGDAAKSVYREDFFDDMLQADNVDLKQDFVLQGIPVKGLPSPP